MDQVEVTKPLSELGVDSLMGVELRLAAEEQLGIDVPLLAIGGAGSIIDLADRCLRQLRSAGHTEAHAG
jgi:acyl carrier protein